MKTESTVTMKSSVVGFLDSTAHGHALGWAYAPDSPAERIMISIYNGDNLVGQGKANLFRQDLLEAGVGNGEYSFKIPLSYELGDGDQHRISAWCLGKTHELKGSPQTAKFIGTVHNFDLISRNEGRLILKDPSPGLLNGKIKNPENFLKAFELASMLQETMALKDASFAWAALKRSSDEHYLFNCKLAENHLLSGNYEKALEHYLSAASFDITLAWPQIGIINCHRLTKNYIEALHTSEAALKLHPKNKIIIRQQRELVDLFTPLKPAENKDVKRLAHLSKLLCCTNTREHADDEASRVLFSEDACVNKAPGHAITVEAALADTKIFRERLRNLLKRKPAAVDEGS